jgi:glycosidase
MKICGHDAFRVDVIKHLSDYQGMNEDQKSLVAEAHQNIGVSKSTTSINDYKVTLQFRCKQLNAERQSIVK